MSVDNITFNIHTVCTLSARQCTYPCTCTRSWLHSVTHKIEYKASGFLVEEFDSSTSRYHKLPLPLQKTVPSP